MLFKAINQEGLSFSEMTDLMKKSLENRKLKKVLMIPPDMTRLKSKTGELTNFCYHYFINKGISVDIIPAVGTHKAMSEEECQIMFGDIPYSCFIYHDWRNNLADLGVVDKKYLKEITGGLWKEDISCQVNKLLLDETYDLILSLGQVLPHEVVGMSNHSKNLFVGVGGEDMINKSHMLSALYGMEKVMGKDFSPTRKLFDYCLEKYLQKPKVLYVHTVTSTNKENTKVLGLFIGEERDSLEEAIALSQKVNINWLEKEIKKCVVFLNPKEFKSTWVGNKAIYRTRMALADGGELVILAPGIEMFGEDETFDCLIRKYGYCGTEKMIEEFEKQADLKENMAAVAHLIHGSSEGRFTITLASQNISMEEVEAVGYFAGLYENLKEKYKPDTLKEGWNILEDGEEIYFISQVSSGLWLSEKHKD